MNTRPRRHLLLEPFYGGSHRRFCETLTTRISAQWSMLTLPARHWKWRARSCVTFWSQENEATLSQEFDLIFTSSLVPICELFAFFPHLNDVPIVVYCHENQFTYPNRNHNNRDHHFAFTELVNFLRATHVVFNSEFNRQSFLENGRAFLERMPDCSLVGRLPEVEEKSSVLPVLFDQPQVTPGTTKSFHPDGPLVLWNHRWEHDKDPETFFKVLETLKDSGHRFRLSLCGERFRRVPDCFVRAREIFAENLVNHTPFRKHQEYVSVLKKADIVVSTSLHEFFGISMLEAAMSGVYPLVPDRLVYPEIYPSTFRYRSPDGLKLKLSNLIKRYHASSSLRDDRRHLFDSFVDGVPERYRVLFESLYA